MEYMQMVMDSVSCDYLERVTISKNGTTLREPLPPKKDQTKRLNKRIIIHSFGN